MRYFEGLNGLRFFAAFLVVVHHIEQIKRNLGLVNLKHLSFFNNGGTAVEFFFVLSGFLITYLLLTESEQPGGIRVRRFYMRRLLRIWPLYYLIAVIGFVVLPLLTPLVGIEAEFSYLSPEGGFLYLFFLPNLATVLYGSNFLYPLWSIGVEEQFYLLWAPLMKWFRKHLVVLFSTIISVKIFFYVFILIRPEAFSEHLVTFMKLLKFESMSIGALGAWYVHRQRSRQIAEWIFARSTQAVFWTLIAAFLVGRNALSTLIPAYGIVFTVSPLTTLVTSSIFLLIILNVSLNEHSFVRLRGPTLNWLGEVSYGIYMYHMLVVLTVLHLAGAWLESFPPPISFSVQYAVILFAVVGVSHFSYTWFESRILRLKKRYA